VLLYAPQGYKVKENHPQKTSIAPIVMPKEDGRAITHLESNVSEESFPTSSNKLPQT